MSQSKRKQAKANDAEENKGWVNRRKWTIKETCSMNINTKTSGDPGQQKILRWFLNND